MARSCLRDEKPIKPTRLQRMHFPQGLPVSIKGNIA
uniref:Uncharacterized protein n=1 Tax=Anguilla anguilla TaxID=7936 RepID=A0A0E9QIL7_ANGAN